MDKLSYHRHRYPSIVINVAALSLVAGLACWTPAESQTPADPLPSVGAVIDETSASGISSGAYMAGQFAVAHSKIVKGAAIIAGGPFGCAENDAGKYSVFPSANNEQQAIFGCMLNVPGYWGIWRLWDTPSPERLAENTRKLAQDGRIDPIESLTRERVYLFSGTEDHTVASAIMEAAAEYYSRIGIPAENIKYVKNVAAGHGFVTEDQGGACGYTGYPYVVDCHYDQAGDLLKTIYGQLHPRAPEESGTLAAFDQRPFTASLSNPGLADEGYVYIPAACKVDATCRIHVAFHGCLQNHDTVGDEFVKHTGFARWADANGIVVLFPQVASGNLSNPQGCWDWWGYTGSDYLTHDAPQIEAIYSMLEKLAGSRTLGSGQNANK
jgi:poly(3-hydroxybutyrate) depolymerase